MFTEYFDTETIDGAEVVDIWKAIDISEFSDLETDTLHVLNENENLMDLSFKYYDTIDDWWIIFLYNDLYDSNFNLLNSKTIETTQNKYIYDLMNYSNLTKSTKQYIRYLVREFYIAKEYSLKESISKVEEIINSGLTDEFTNDFKLYIYETMISKSYFRIQLKIPSNLVVYKIKNELETLSLVWKNK